MDLRRYLLHRGSLHISAGSKDKRLSLSFAGGVRVRKETFPSYPSSARIFSIPKVRSPSIWTSFSLYPFGFFNLLTCKTSLSPLFSGVSAPASATFPPRLSAPFFLCTSALSVSSGLLRYNSFSLPRSLAPLTPVNPCPYHPTPSCPLAQHTYISAFLPTVLPRFP